MENITFKNKCPKWVIEPDAIQPESDKDFEEKHHVCKCSLWVCGWRRGRIDKTRNRIIDKIRKFTWPEIVRMARVLGIEIA